MLELAMLASFIAALGLGTFSSVMIAIATLFRIDKFNLFAIVALILGIVCAGIGMTLLLILLARLAIGR